MINQKGGGHNSEVDGCDIKRQLDAPADKENRIIKLESPVPLD